MTTAKIKVHAIYTDSSVNDLLVKEMLTVTNSVYLTIAPSLSFELASSEQLFDSALIDDGPTSKVGLDFHTARQARAVRYPGKVVVIFRSPGGNQSSPWADYIVMNGTNGLTFAHEFGHYLHLGHTHNDTNTNALDAANKLGGNDAAKSLAIDLIRKGGLGVFDGDAGDPSAPEGNRFAGIGDTSPDPGPPLFQPTYYTKDGTGHKSSTAIANEECSGTISLVVGAETYVLAPDRTNVMSYFGACTPNTHTFSPHQRQVIERVITSSNRRQLMNGASPEGPASVVTTDGFIHVFARGDDRNIWHNYWNGKVWSGWRGGDLGGGTLISGPAAVATANGGIHVFAQGLDRNIWHSFWNGGAWSGWRGTDLAGKTLTSAPTAVVTTDGFIHVFARGDDRNIWHNFWNGKVWSGWKGGELGAGTLMSGPTAVVTTGGNIHVFAQGDDRNIWHSFWDGKTWSGWRGSDLAGRTLTSGPAAVTTDGAIHVFARGDDRNIWHSFWNGKVWSGWHADLSGGTFMSGLATVVSSDKALHAFALGDARSIVHSFCIGQTWSGWGSELGGGTFQP